MTPSDSFINALGVAVPSHEHSQTQLADFMANALQLDASARRRLTALYRQTTIHRRYSVLPDYSRANGAFTSFPNTPGLEPFPSVGQRMGYYGAFNGLKAADAIVRADPEAAELVVCVELCTIHFQKTDGPSNWLANALFDDGAAAVLVQGKARFAQLFALHSFHCELLPAGREQMAWSIGDHGLDMVLSSKIPDLIRQHISAMLHQILDKNGLGVSDVYQFAIHPGGRRILDLTVPEPAHSQILDVIEA